MGERYGKMAFVEFPLPAVMVFDPELAEKGLRNQGPTPSRGEILPWNDYRIERNEKSGLLTSEGEDWKKSRCGGRVREKEE